MTDVESGCTTSDENESEGSLVDFIVHDEESTDDDGDFDPMDYEESDGEIMEEDGGVEEDAGGEDDAGEEDAGGEDAEEDDAEEEGQVPLVATPGDDEMVRAQYTGNMEHEGSVFTSTGIRRSMRTSKGRAPLRYVDDDYVGLMTEDVDSDINWSSQEDSGEEDD